MIPILDNICKLYISEEIAYKFVKIALLRSYVHMFFNKTLSTALHRKSQKQLPEVFFEKKCSQKFRKFHRKTPLLECLFNECAGLFFNKTANTPESNN